MPDDLVEGIFNQLCLTFFQPCQLCAHVVVVVGLVCFNDPWGYTVEPLMPDRSRVSFQTKRDTGV